MSPREFALLLYKKALEDLYAVEKLLPDPDCPDALIGFHAQQAVEKLLKAVLTHEGISYRKTHHLVRLADLLLEGGIGLPEQVEELTRLGPFATTLRYEDLDIEEEPLDREWAIGLVLLAKVWAQRKLGV